MWLPSCKKIKANHFLSYLSVGIFEFQLQTDTIAIEVRIYFLRGKQYSTRQEKEQTGSSTGAKRRSSYEEKSNTSAEGVPHNNTIEGYKWKIQRERYERCWAIQMKNTNQYYEYKERKDKDNTN